MLARGGPWRERRRCTVCLTCTVHQMHIAGMRLSEFLAETGTKPTVLAREIGVAHSTVLRWASGEVIPSMEAMRRVAEATDGRVMPNDFMAPASAA